MFCTVAEEDNVARVERVYFAEPINLIELFWFYCI